MNQDYHWKLCLYEMHVHIRNNPTPNLLSDERERILNKIETMYTYIPFRNSLEKAFSSIKDVNLMKSHAWFLLWLWARKANHSSKQTDIQLQQHWLKLWMDCLIRYEDLNNVKLFHSIWPDMREWLLKYNYMKKWLVCWGNLLGSYYKIIKNIKSVARLTLNQLYVIKKALVMWNWNQTILHPINHCRRNASMRHFANEQATRNRKDLFIHKDLVISTEDIWQNNNNYILLPMLHLNNNYISQQVLLSHSLLHIGTKLQSLIREQIANMYIYDTTNTITDTFKETNKYYTFSSPYSELYKEQLDDIKYHGEQLKRESISIHKRYANVVECVEWFNLLKWNIHLVHRTGWIYDSLFQNIGFSIIPHRRIQLRPYAKFIDNEFVCILCNFIKRFMRENWGNITHRTSLLLFISNSELSVNSKQRSSIFNKYWLNDIRYTQDTNPLFNTTQTYSTNKRILFHYMRSGWYIKESIPGICHLIVYELTVMKRKLTAYFRNNDYINTRPNSENITRKLGLNTANNRISDQNRLHRQIQDLMGEKVLEVNTMQEVLYQTLEWLSRVQFLPLFSVLELEEVLRTFWDVLSKLELTERIPELYNITSPMQLLAKNPAWIVPLRTSELSDEILSWWGIQKIETDDDVESPSSPNIDIITKLPIEDPVTLPSGHVVDRSTYTILLQSSGKDPFNMEPLV